MAKLTKAQVLSSLRDEVTSLIAVITTKQEAYRLRASHARPRYFQLLPTHRSIPKDGERLPPDNLQAKPDYQPDSLTALGLPSLTDLPFVLTIDQYQSDQGPGFIVHLELELDGKRHLYRHNVGPETSQHQANFLER